MSAPSDIRVVDLREKLASFTETWSPRVVAELNGQHVKVARLEGEFCWHAHEHEDELFLVLAGELVVELPDGERVLTEGQLLVVPRGVRHRPVAARGQVHALLFEPAGTLNTGDADDPRRVDEPERA